jgi:hypothetical protein
LTSGRLPLPCLRKQHVFQKYICGLQREYATVARHITSGVSRYAERKIKMYCASNIGNFISSAGVLVAIGALFYQIRRSRFSQNIDLTLRLEKEFDSKEFKEKRKLAAQSMLKKEYKNAEDVFDFFETLGLLVRRKAVDKQFAWHSFYYWVHRYWSSGCEYINEKRKNEPALFENFKKLHEELIKIEAKESNVSTSDLCLSSESINEFIIEESE